MAEDVLILKGWGNVDVQIGGPGNPWMYLSPTATMSGPSIPLGGTEIRWEQDPNKANGFKISSKFRTAPGQIGADITTKLGKINYLSDLFCTFGMRARFAACGEREDPSNWDPLILAFCDVDLTDYSYDDLVITDPANQDEIMVTSPWQARYELRIEKMEPGRLGSASELGDQPLNDVEFCDTASCGGYCGDRSDGASIIYGVTDADAAPYAAANFVKGVKNVSTGAWTWTTAPILGLNGNVEAIECAGSRHVVSSNSDSAIAYNDNDGDQDEWITVSLANAPAARHTALYARTPRELWVAAASGFIYKSIDGGITWNAVHSGTLTAENLNGVFAYSKNLIYACGDNGVMIKSTDGGSTWSDITETSTTSANLLKIVVPPERPKEVYVSTNDGQIFRSKDEGATFSRMPIDGDGVGTIDDFDFCGPCAGDVLFILHNDGGPRGRILRDLSGGNGGADIEIVSDYTQIISAGIQLNALACASGNEIIAGGENNGGYPVLIKAS